MPVSRLVLAALVLAAPAPADDPKPVEGLVVVDATGKERPLKNGRIVTGTRKIPWHEGGPAEALSFRETDSTTYRDGVLTLVPLNRLESLTYDPAKETVSARVRGLDAPLLGSTQFRGVNQLTIEAEEDRGADGVAEVKYTGGIAKGGIKGVKFPEANAAPTPGGGKMYLTISDGKKSYPAQAVERVRALYKYADGSEQLSNVLMFKKTFKLDLGKVKRLAVTDGESRDVACAITTTDGAEQTLTLLPNPTIEGKPATLEGLVVTVPAGYKLVPLHCLGELTSDAPKKQPEKKDD